MVEDTAHGPVGGGGFGLGGQGWSVWVYGLVQVSDHTYGTLLTKLLVNDLFTIMVHTLNKQYVQIVLQYSINKKYI